MIQFKVEGVEEQAEYVERMRQNILAAIRTGMTQGMQGLAAAVVERLNEVTTPRTGELSAHIPKTARILEKEGEYIKGEVEGRSGKYRNLGLWIEYGTKYPTKGKRLAFYPKQFQMGRFGAANPDSIRELGHGAFRIEPRPFFNPAFQDYLPTIYETIQQRVAEAVNGTV